MSAIPCALCDKKGYPNEGLKVDKIYYHKICFKCSHCNQRLTMGSFAQMKGTLYCKTHFKQLFASLGGSYDKVLESGRSSMLSRSGNNSGAESGYNSGADSADESTVSEQPASEKPASEKPASEKPASEKPVSEKPVINERKFASAFEAYEKKDEVSQPLSITITSDNSEVRSGKAPLKSPKKSPRMPTVKSSARGCVFCDKKGYPKEGLVVNKLYYHKRCFKCSHCNQKLTMGSFAQMQGTLYCKTHFKQLFASCGGSYDKVLDSGRSSMAARKSPAVMMEDKFSFDQEQPEPVTEEAEPVTEESDPVTEEPEPVAEESEQVTEEDEPVAEVYEPAVEISDPPSEELQTIIEEVEPAVPTPEPEEVSADEVEPATEEAEPVAEEAESVTEEAESVTEEAEPVAKEAEPVAEEAEPVAGEAEPVVEEAELVAEEAGPVVKEAEPVAE
eukprot:18663_1